MASSKDEGIPSGDRTLKGTTFIRENGQTGDAALLFVHGLGSSQAAYADRARKVSDNLGIRCLTFDLSGHGHDRASADRFSVYDHIGDVIAACDYLAAKANPHSGRIGACGASYGAYLAALLPEHRSVQRLLLRAPAVAGDVEFPAPERTPIPGYLAGRPDAFDSLSALSRFTGPVLILESELDERIPHSQILAHLDACPQAKHEVIAGATHALTDPVWDAVFVDAIIRWFRNL